MGKECFCGQYYGMKDVHHQHDTNNNTFPSHYMMDDASFVHMPPSPPSPPTPPPPIAATAAASTLPTTSSSITSRTSVVHPKNGGNNRNTNYNDKTEDCSLPTNLPGGVSISNTTTERFRHLQRLEQASIATATTYDDDNTSSSTATPCPDLCLDCIHRVEQALYQETARLECECHIYRNAMEQETDRIQRLDRVWTTATAAVFTTVVAEQEINSTTVTDTHPSERRHYAELAFREEINQLQIACQQHEYEFKHLQNLQRDQAQLSRDVESWRIHQAHTHNALALEARAFDYKQQVLERQLQQAQVQVQRLESSYIALPALMHIHIRVDQSRGIRYPLINDLRLARCPKGDLEWTEIQAAWSLTAQLLLVVARIFDFTSPHWKVVPLTPGAKLIHYRTYNNNTINASAKEQRSTTTTTSNSSSAPTPTSSTTTTSGAIVYNLLGQSAKGSRQAIQAWSNLLYLVVQHAQQRLTEAQAAGLLPTSSASSESLPARPLPPLPFPFDSPTSLGGISLSNLIAQENGMKSNMMNSTKNHQNHSDDSDAEWSRVLHCLMSNLWWLAECAAIYVQQQVVLSSYAS